MHSAGCSGAAPPPCCRLRNVLTVTLALLSVLSCYYAFTACKPKPEGQLALGGDGPPVRQEGGIYVWDPAAELPGLPPCDHQDPTSLAPVVKQLVLRRFPKLAECHEEYQYAAAWYLERALLRAHGQLAHSVDSADVVLVASSCYYEAAFWSRWGAVLGRAVSSGVTCAAWALGQQVAGYKPAAQSGLTTVLPGLLQRFVAKATEPALRARKLWLHPICPSSCRTRLQRLAPSAGSSASSQQTSWPG